MTPSQQIDNKIIELKDWRGKLITEIRKTIHSADSKITEEWKWNTPVFAHDGLVCAIGIFKDHLKINFFKGASLDDQDSLFNSGLEAKATRAIDIYEEDTFNKIAFKKLVKTAVLFNLG